ncbi:MAG: hypothetical protein ACYYK0_00430 [Candidatus Eutrophobiaceae bacterium]
MKWLATQDYAIPHLDGVMWNFKPACAKCAEMDITQTHAWYALHQLRTSSLCGQGAQQARRQKISSCGAVSKAAAMDLREQSSLPGAIEAGRALNGISMLSACH